MPYRRKTDSLPTCMNCSAVLYGAYCSQCGQRSAEPITWRRVASEILKSIRTLDSRWLRTAAALTIDPGRMVRRYIRGRRQPFVAPPLYALAAVALCVGLVAWQRVDLGAPGTPWSSPSAEAAVDRSESPAGLEHAVFAWCALASLLVAAVTALFQNRLFPGQDFTWLETYVFTLFVFGHLALHQALFALIGAFSSTTGLAALAVVIVVFLAFALAGFYRRSFLASLPAAVLLATVQVAGVFVAGSLARMAVWG